MANFNNLPNEISEEIYPSTFSLQEFSIAALNRLSEHVRVDPSFSLKAKHVTLSNNISYNEEGLLVTVLDLLFEALMNVKEVELNLIYKNNQISSGFINGILKQSFENKIILRTLKIDSATRLGGIEFDGPEVTLDIKITLQNSGLHL